MTCQQDDKTWQHDKTWQDMTTTRKNHILDWQTTHLRHDITDTQAASEMSNIGMQQPSVLTYMEDKRQKHKLLTKVENLLLGISRLKKIIIKKK